LVSKGSSLSRPLTVIMAHWRSGPDAAAERQVYSRRKTLITEIKRLAAVEDPSQGDPYDIVVNRLEDDRIRAKASLSKVIDAIRRG